MALAPRTPLLAARGRPGHRATVPQVSRRPRRWLWARSRLSCTVSSCGKSSKLQHLPLQRLGFQGSWTNCRGSWPRSCCLCLAPLRLRVSGSQRFTCQGHISSHSATTQGAGFVHTPALCLQGVRTPHLNFLLPKRAPLRGGRASSAGRGAGGPWERPEARAARSGRGGAGQGGQLRAGVGTHRRPGQGTGNRSGSRGRGRWAEVDVGAAES